MACSRSNSPGISCRAQPRWRRLPIRRLPNPPRFWPSSARTRSGTPLRWSCCQCTTWRCGCIFSTLRRASRRCIGASATTTGCSGLCSLTMRSPACCARAGGAKRSATPGLPGTARPRRGRRNTSCMSVRRWTICPQSSNSRSTPSQRLSARTSSGAGSVRSAASRQAGRLFFRPGLAAAGVRVDWQVRGGCSSAGGAVHRPDRFRWTVVLGHGSAPIRAGFAVATIAELAPVAHRPDCCLRARGQGSRHQRSFLHPQADRTGRSRPGVLDPEPGNLAWTGRNRAGGGLSIDCELVLSPDVRIDPVLELSPDLRAKIDASDQDFTVTRRRARATSRVVDKDSAELLQKFRVPTRIVDAVLSFAGERGLHPESTLEQAYPVLSRLYRSRFLVPAHSDAARPIEGQLEPGDVVDGFRLIRCIQIFEDNEVFVARDDAGRYAAVKFYREPSPDQIAMLQGEAGLMGRAGGARAPQVLGLTQVGSGLALAAEWVFGDDALAAAESLRGRQGSRSDHPLLALCAEFAAAFADIHESGLLHGDVHPRNVLVEKSGTVRLIDFGLAREIDVPSDGNLRGGVPFYFDPEFARAQRDQAVVAASCLAVQYSVAALIYQMWTGVHYLDWSLEREAMLRQIVEAEPVPFQARRVPPWPELEQILRRAG